MFARACMHAYVMCLQYAIILFWPRLIIIIFKIIILYFIQIRHTDDFPSTATRLVSLKALTRQNVIDLDNYVCFVGFCQFWTVFAGKN